MPVCHQLVVAVPAVSEASTVSAMGAFGCGCTNKVALKAALWIL